MQHVRSTPFLVTVFLLTAATGCAKSSSNADSAAGRADTTASAGAVSTTPAVGTSTGASGTSTGTAANSADAGVMLDPNSATKEQLAAAPGMTAPGADALIAGRPYATMVAVDQALAKQISDSAARKKIYAVVWKPIDPTTASDAEILLIPGVGPRMLHEFKEYRPWKSTEQFRREIGKYVDKGELARLEKYIRIK